MFPDQLHVWGQLNIEIMSHVSPVVSHEMKGEDKLCRGIGQPPNNGSKENNHKKVGIHSHLLKPTWKALYIYTSVGASPYISCYRTLSFAESRSQSIFAVNLKTCILDVYVKARW